MPRPPRDTVQISARVPTSWVALADAIGAKLSRPGLEVSRADAYRIALARGFEELRAELGLPPVEAPEPKAPKPKARGRK